ncbi:MAG: LLM class flavin-dependent oxidoreductase [Acidimicrobiales bacterium]
MKLHEARNSPRCPATHLSEGSRRATTGTCRTSSGPTSSATRSSGWASTTPWCGSRTRRPICWWWKACARPRTSASVRAGSASPTTHPSRWANRVAMLDHISGGRFNFGFAARLTCSTDWEMFGVDGMGGENQMTRESIEIIMNLWTQEPGWSYEGKFWKAAVPNEIPPLLKRHILPLQQPHPPIGVAGLSPRRRPPRARRREGLIPMSLNLNPGYCKSYWDSYEAGPAGRVGRAFSRSEWRGGRRGVQADTDEEAWEHSGQRSPGRMQRAVLPAAAGLVRVPALLQGRRRPPRRGGDRRVLRRAQLADRFAPDVAAEKLEKVYADVGGFGHIPILGIDYVDDEPAWKRSMELMANEVMPRVAHLTMTDRRIRNDQVL